MTERFFRVEVTTNQTFIIGDEHMDAGLAETIIKDQINEQDWEQHEVPAQYTSVSIDSVVEVDEDFEELDLWTVTCTEHSDFRITCDSVADAWFMGGRHTILLENACGFRSLLVTKV